MKSPWASNYVRRMSDKVLNPTKTVTERVEAHVGIKPQRLIGDVADGTAAMLKGGVETNQIEPHTPLWRKL
jgi:hypothetical protein